MATKKIRILIMASMIITLFALLVHADNPPQRTTDFRGFAYLDGSPVPDGAVVSIWANDGSLKMDEFTLQYSNGYFHNLEIVWDDPATPADEGLTYDETTLETINFKVDSVIAAETSSVKASQEGETIDIVLTSFTPLSEQVPEEQEEVAPAHAEARPLEEEEKIEGTPPGKEEVPGVPEGPSKPEIMIPFIEMPLAVPTNALIVGIVLMVIIFISVIIWILSRYLREEAYIGLLLERLEKIEKKEKGKSKK